MRGEIIWDKASSAGSSTAWVELVIGGKSSVERRS